MERSAREAAREAVAAFHEYSWLRLADDVVLVTPSESLEPGGGSCQRSCCCCPQLPARASADGQGFGAAPAGRVGTHFLLNMLA